MYGQLQVQISKYKSKVKKLRDHNKNSNDRRLRACLHGGGGPQVGEVTRGGSPHLSCKRDQIKMRDYMDRRVTSPTRGPPPPCKQAQDQ